MDTKFALRSLLKNPGFTLLAVLILALGIGANTAMFSVVNAVLLRPLAYRDPDRIVTLSTRWTKGGGPGALWKQISLPDFQDWRDQSTAFQALAYYTGRETSVMPGAAAEYAVVTRVSPEFFRAFEVQPAIGRLFSAEEIKPRSAGAAVVSDAYWKNHFGGNKATTIPQTIRMMEHAVTIVGVMPAGFFFPDKTDIWIPANTITQETGEYRSGLNYLAIGRLKPGVSLEQAQTQMASIGARLEKQYPQSNAGRSVAVTRLRDEMVGDVRLTLYLLLGAVGVVLLIACANVATLLLARATGRRREMAIRAALGAGRGRMVRQLITESLLLAGASGIAGLLLAVWGSAALVAIAPTDVPRLVEAGIDGWVLAFTIIVSAITSVLFGLAPALQASRVDSNDALKQGAARAVVGGSAGRMRNALVVAEVALSVMLLAGAGLLIKSFVALQHVALGFHPENVLVMRATVPAMNEAGARRANQFFHDVLTDVSVLPGVQAVGATMSPPGHIDSSSAYWIDRLPSDGKLDTAGREAVISIVAPGTFAALGIPLRRGRDFSDGDRPDTPFSAIVNDTLARRALPGRDPLGHTIYCPFDSMKPMTIVGVVGDVRQNGPANNPMPECFMPYTQHLYNGNTLSLVVRTAMDPNGLVEEIRRRAHQRSSEVSVKFTTMQASLSENVATPRFRTLLLGIFAALAVALAMAGVYGVMAYVVGQRSNEIGLRMALGASPGDVQRLVLKQSFGLAGTGLVIGMIGAVAATRLLTSMLFEVKPSDPATYAAVALLLGVVALAAGYFPARRAARVDPLVALRQE
ncbi:MAG TPA: ABC transporter permease [Bryobacteraceae bacterium]|nr:ABC transporter permease [Bryobacteraceae bacterium]